MMSMSEILECHYIALNDPVEGKVICSCRETIDEMEHAQHQEDELRKAGYIHRSEK